MWIDNMLGNDERPVYEKELIICGLCGKLTRVRLMWIKTRNEALYVRVMQHTCGG